MKLLITAILVAATSAARLENTYLPPSSARFAGGSGNILSTPFGSSTAGLNRAGLIAAPSFGSISSPAGFASPAAAARSYSGPAAPLVPILRLNSDNDGTGSYRYEYETANHIAAQEAGHLKNADTSEVQGSFSYQSPDGQSISVSYVADENGFRPSGDHLPTPPPVPEAILKSLQINAAEEARGGFNGQYGAPSVAAAKQLGGPISNQYLPPTARQGY